MNTEISGILFMYVLAILMALPLGRYISGVFNNERNRADKLFSHLDNFIFRLSGIDPLKEMSWKQHVYALLLINLVWFILSMLVLTNMEWLPLNPDGNPSMAIDLAFNTSVSFITNTNLQHYSGETGVSYLGQLILMLWQFVSAATGIAACAILFTAMKEQSAASLGNFYRFFVRSCTRILFPLALLIAAFLVFNGVPMTFEGKDTTITLQGDTVQVSQGPVAAFVAIKHLGTNGGGFFGTNSAHPFENPTYFTNMIEMVSQMLIPLALVFALGFSLRKKRLSYMIFGVMTAGFLCLAIPTVIAEMKAPATIQGLGISAQAGNMEGKETRFGPAASGFWSIATTVISTGSVNSMHDSFTPLSQMNQMLAMMVNCFYGGCGVGLLNFYIFIILAVFISGLMVGRTPEFLGKKIEGREIKIAMGIALLPPLLILTGTAITSYMYVNNPAIYSGWLANNGYHGFSEILYEFTSSAANNGSGLEGLGDNTVFWNVSSGLLMLLGRYLPVIGPLAIAGILAGKKYVPETAGTLKTDTSTFGLMVFAVIFIVAALSFFPALALGPIAEYFSIF